ncbi:hypothetical protein fugu_014985 [Takifugu bimaculatus]|uniref:TNF family profile domain-containing protein n=1 Tax=Takifugu bimaculatus TaxID=433685 RepID=A0A4Z2BXI4_9TELE|nr:hypothetical protein fugu_014985 [Takifugu bimaculatus]
MCFLLFQLPPPDRNYALIKGQMFTYKARKENGKIKWIARHSTNELIEEDTKGLKIKEAGHYFLNLQVTQKTCNRTRGPELTVSIKYNDRKLLLGKINRQTCSTGLLAKVEALARGAILEITEIASEDIDDSEALTHLDIIMLQPRAMA